MQISSSEASNFTDRFKLVPVKNVKVLPSYYTDHQNPKYFISSANDPNRDKFQMQRRVNNLRNRAPNEYEGIAPTTSNKRIRPQSSKVRKDT